MKRIGCKALSAVGFCLLIAFARPALAQERAPEQAPAQTGIFTTQFSERSKWSDADLMAEVAHWRREQIKDYDIADHTFQLVVPKDYDGSEPYGLIVFIHPNDEISLDRFFGKTIEDLLARHKLIWVSYNNAGNKVMSNVRMGLALDAVHNVTKRYRIDSERVYVSGMSGGGRLACMSGIYYPQVFKGAAPIVGSLYFSEVKVPQEPELRALLREQPKDDNAVWPAALITPVRRQLLDMKKNQRWVLVTGEKDFNMPEMRAHFEQGFKQDGFEHAHYLEVPGMAHTYPSAEWFEKAIVLLDQPIVDAAQAKANQPPADEQTQRLAQRRLEVALRTLDKDRDRGVRALQRLVEELPNTDAAEQARAKLAELSQPDQPKP